METSQECVCYKEVSSIMDKLDELDESSHVHVGRASWVCNRVSRYLGSSDCLLQRNWWKDSVLASMHILPSYPSQGAYMPSASHRRGPDCGGERDVNGARKLIPDLATWMQCFALYMAITTDKNTGCTKSMQAYMTIIAKASTKYMCTSGHHG